jgi:hypothetical protein
MYISFDSFVSGQSKNDIEIDLALKGKGHINILVTIERTLETCISIDLSAQEEFEICCDLDLNF